ncbi:bacillithiol system protein YtxJ [Lutibacter oricola]|uniref:Bacillithiol system protein YtxJ n=1 Tax=Lutibacter oricola TaxID=762486 RepID=A0A1H2XKJ2_9FLAO|nr:bacillithiol system redox-active protein YtxJ [Lutibacter oricola]SDW93360.1 bacillithiol system protein YtxJ [Lutibacter oricola]
MNWLELTTIEQLDELINDSNNKPILIFKHSTRCGISRFALSGFERSYNINKESLSVYFLDLLKYREVSNAIAEKLKVQHQSPQAIVISKEKVIYSASHSDISAEDIKKAIG